MVTLNTVHLLKQNAENITDFTMSRLKERQSVIVVTVELSESLYHFHIS
jgi:hypothetical protein